MKIIAAPISCLILLAALLSCTRSSDHKDNDQHDGKMFLKAATYATPSGGFGYEIYADDSLYIRQPFIPGIAGEHPFASKEEAMRIAELAIHKMATQQAMPRITKEDLIQQQIQLPN